MMRCRSDTQGKARDWDVFFWLRTFSSFPAQGLGEWCAGLIWRRKECVQETDLCLTFWRRLDIITAVLYNKCGVDEF